ncbi:MAG: type IX secretion system sortase PorU [Candidatus Kapabacteria bacterium]|nr:type IX secretion system sortase PorU [Candidatus Kapabacteria bacterium]
MLLLFLGLGFAGNFAPASAQTQASPNSPKVPTPNNWSWCGVTLVESSPVGIVIDYTPQVKGFDTIFINGKSLLRPKILGAVPDAEHIGAPLCIEMRIPLTVPSPNGFRILSHNLRAVKSVQSAMAPRPAMNSNGEPEYRLNNDVYNSEPTAEWYSVKYSGLGRDRHIATLKLRAARYNPETQTIEIPQSIRIALEFLPSQAQTLNPAQTLIGTAKDAPELGFMTTLNHAQTAAWRVFPETSSNLALPTSSHSDSKTRTATQQSVAGRWLKIGVERDGIYRITAQQLRDAGITVANAEVSSLQMFGNGGVELPESVTLSTTNTMREQPLLVETDASGALTAISFFGCAPNGFVAVNNGTQTPTIQHFVNTFSRRNFYMLNVGGTSQGRRVTFTETSAQATLTPTYHISRVFKDDELENPYDAGLFGSGRRWFGQRFDHNRATRIETNLPRLARVSVPILYRISAAWNNRSGSGPGGKIFVREAGTEVFASPFSFEGSGNDYSVGTVETRTATVPANIIQNNRSTLEFLYIANVGNDSHGILDWFEIHYPREFVAADNQLDFFTDTPVNARGVAEYTVRGFTGSQVFIVDATDRTSPQFVRNTSPISTQATFRASISPENPRRFYLSSQTLSVASLERVEDIADLRGTPANADLIVITHKDLLSSAQAYREYRQRQSNMTVALATTDQIYYQFNGGTPDQTAIRDYIAHAFRTWQRKPRYVLFWGDSYFDFRGIIPNIAAKNLVPTYQVFDADGELNSIGTNYNTEDFFGCVNGEDSIIDVSLGRLCVRTNEEGATMLSKIRRYETGSSQDNWRTRILLTADDAPTTSLSNSDGSLHTSQSEDISNFVLPPTVRQRKTYLADFPTENTPGGRRRPAATQDLIAGVNEGALILNWIGHGNPQLWANEQFLVRDVNIAQFTNLDRLFFLVAATCDFARFDTKEQSGAEEMMSSPRGGAIAVFAATRTVYASDNAFISQELYRQIFRNTGSNDAPRFGDLMFNVKQIFASGFQNNDRKFCLLGDPTVRLALPEQPVAIDSLNGAELSNPANQPQVKALSQMAVSGRIVVPSTGVLDTAFTGSILASLHDTDIQRIINDIDEARTQHRITTLGGLLNIGAGTVRGGRFRLNLPIPKDISFSNRPGRLFVYAVSTDGRKFGRGATSQFTIGDVDETAVNDGIGPEIRLFLDTRSFKAGDFVGTTPTLIADIYDATGVNATGTGIGHDIQCWIDNNPIPITLTQSYRISLEDPRRGTVERILSALSPGLHRIRVRAWDIFNNYSESETYFRVVGAGEQLVLTELLNYPNPFTETTTLRFRHNQITEQPYTVGIYSTNGVPVKIFSGMTTSRTIEIPWDGRDEFGNRVASGAYIFNVNLTDTDGRTTKSASGNIVRSR